ncbi:hypothetical protein GLW04_00110 [Halobacillus litoralis]|uniref:Uncharacterized protein n=1 Tax=Halobacillus litoralis TaxID=45668 RepID=A0A845DMW0_9BACI|nr:MULTISPECIES: hypothetical protein [Halobacillus]MCA1022686.1 hypothetical protein [Halobacillus litoralis]MYL18269.1 hypothetical protein [Halobacillus litoralis]MYL30723.1 hypothetical protein [Halobacillus halophilus]
MSQNADLIHHYTEFASFEADGLQKGEIDFPEFEKVLNDYILSQPKETMEFKECWVYEEQDGLRTVRTDFYDHNLKNDIRLWGSRNPEDGQVKSLNVDALDVSTNEVVYERKLM